MQDRACITPVMCVGLVRATQSQMMLQGVRFTCICKAQGVVDGTLHQQTPGTKNCSPSTQTDTTMKRVSINLPDSAKAENIHKPLQR